jgi:hypothetical protein
MQTKVPGMLLILLCAGSFFLIPSVWAQQQTPSVLSRVQTVEDPELGDLIRVAVENHQRTHDNPAQNVSPQELEIVQKVTESYARIKLLDEQIEQTARKIKGGGSAEVLQEMTLAKAELESKRTTELGKLREVMGVIPAHAFGRRPTDELKTWLHLDVAGDRVVVTEDAASGKSSTLAGVMTKSAGIEYIARQLKGENRLPIRIDIHRTADGVSLSEQLESEVIQLVKKSNVQMQAEVHLDEAIQVRHVHGLFVQDRRVWTSLNQQQGKRSYVTGLIEPNDLTGTVERWIVGPRKVPATILINYWRGEEEAAAQVSQSVTETTRRLGLSAFVDIKRMLLPPDPVELYLGRWEAAGEGDITALDVRENGNVVMSQRTTSMAVSWSLRDRTLVVNTGSRLYQGELDSQGRLVITSGGNTQIFAKVK